MIENKDICCNKLLKIIYDQEFVIKYECQYRYFMFESWQGEFCPFCSKRFPAELINFYFYVLKHELKIDRDNMSAREFERLKLPKEFSNDQWWLKRQHLTNFPHKDLSKRPDWSSWEDYFYNLPIYSQDSEEYLKYHAKIKLKAIEWKEQNFFCCWRLLIDHIEPMICRNHPLNLCNKSLIMYEPEKRRYLLRNRTVAEKAIFFKKKPLRMMHLQLNFCHWCGVKFPKSLAREWFEIVTKQFGVKNIYNQKELAAKLPAEYLTQEWWFSRGL